MPCLSWRHQNALSHPAGGRTTFAESRRRRDFRGNPATTGLPKGISLNSSHLKMKIALKLGVLASRRRLSGLSCPIRRRSFCINAQKWPLTMPFALHGYTYAFRGKHAVEALTMRSTAIWPFSKHISQLQKAISAAPTGLVYLETFDLETTRRPCILCFF